MQPAPEAVSRGPPEPYIIDGQPYYDARGMARIIGPIVNPATVHRWVHQGHTPAPSGIDLRVKRYSSPHSRSGQPRRQKRGGVYAPDFRLVVPQEAVYEVKAYLDLYGLRRVHRAVTDHQMIEAARLFYERKFTRKQIAEHFNICRDTVTRILKEAEERKIVKIVVAGEDKDEGPGRRFRSPVDRHSKIPLALG